MTTTTTFSVTTPIFYVNDVPHVGHAYSLVLADVLARWHRQAGRTTRLQTGTDEHGQKIVRSASAAGTSPRDWVDRLVGEAWRPLLAVLDIHVDDFVRTTEERHARGVRAFLEGLRERGDVYEDRYEGLYCVGCEDYKSTAELVGDEQALLCPVHARPVEVLAEENWFFRLSRYQDRLLALYQERPDFIQPESARREVVQFVTGGLRDLSISRTSINWGIRLPWAPGHVTYVWFDALLNYLTGLGYGSEDDRLLTTFWPSTHVVGKDIAKFHAVIWPAMLLSAGLPLPRRVLAHGWLLAEGEKISKSRGNSLAPRDIVDQYGSDAFRWHLATALPLGGDGNITGEDIARRYDARLVNSLGNLASRVTSMCRRWLPDEILSSAGTGPHEQAVEDLCTATAERVTTCIQALDVHAGLAAVDGLVDALNKYVTTAAPWQHAEDGGDRSTLRTILSTAVHGLGVTAVLLSPVMPRAMQQLWVALGGSGSITEHPIDKAPSWRPSTPTTTLDGHLFPRK